MRSRETLRFLAVFCILGLPGIVRQAESPAHPGGPTVAESAPASLDLDEAVRRALIHHPRLRAAAAARRASAARERQSAALPNPTLEADAEDVGLGGPRDGFDAATYTVRVALPVELGGKRATRQRLAATATEVARLDADAAQLAVAADVKSRFWQLLAAQERLQTVTASCDLAITVRDTVAESVRAGKVSPVALTKSEVALAGRRLERHRAEGALAAARAALGALCGVAPAALSNLRVRGDLEQVTAPADLQALLARLPNHPEWTRTETEQELARARVAVERAAAIPDVTVSAGIAHGREEGDETVEFAVSFPLPLFDRNRGNIEAALAEAEQAREERDSRQLALRAELAEQWHQAQSAVAEAHAMRDGVLPGARKAFANAQEAYRSGRLEYLDVLDAQLTLAETEMGYLDALAAVHQALVQIERLAGENPVQE